MSFLLFDYAVSAMQNTAYGFRPRFAVWWEPDLLPEKKWNLLWAPILHKCSPYQCLQSLFYVIALQIKNEEPFFSEHMESKLFNIFLNIYQCRKNKTIFADTFIDIDKKNMQNFRED